ncbi:tetratricopeptide repeat protein [Marivirga sp.]|uniref:tetratricopeptide repeat protein n=1 Tax=Marivirga sp. TaxID=2018662 RepID=UPI003DA749E9
MRKFVQGILLTITLTFLVFNFSSVAQNEDAIKNAKAKYNASIRFNDFQVAKNAIYDLMVLEPNNHSYLDSLAYIYFEFNQYASAALVSREALKRNPNNQLVLQIGAKSLDQLGALDQSLKMYQKLYNISDDAYVLYEVIQKQYALKKYDDAMINTELLLGKNIVNSGSVYAKDKDGNDIEVPFKAVILNMQGLIARGKGDEESAKKYFNNALSLAPKYALPQENLNPKE